MTEEKQTEFVKNAEVKVSGIEVETSQNNPEEIQRIRFVSNKGDITWKPKVTKTIYREGIKIKSKVAMNVNELPQKIKDIAKQIEEEGKVLIKVNYTVMTTTKDNEEVKYRFITSEKTFDSWEIMSSDITKEQELIE